MLKFLSSYKLLLAASLVVVMPAVAERPRFAEVGSWAYQLTGYEGDSLERLAGAKVDLLVIDLARDGGRDYFLPTEVQRLQGTGKHVLAYFELAAIESFRHEWASVPGDLKAGAVSDWEDEQYVRYWDERWWPVVRARIDQAVRAGFDGAYLDMLTTYEEIDEPSLTLQDRGRLMVDLVARISAYAKQRMPSFRIVAQNCPELATGLGDEPRPDERYLGAIDGVAIESPFYQAHNRPCRASWCEENRKNALAIKAKGKLLLGVDYVRGEAKRSDAYKRQRKAGFVPYASVRELDRYISEDDPD